MGSFLRVRCKSREGNTPFSELQATVLPLKRCFSLLFYCLVLWPHVSTQGRGLIRDETRGVYFWARTALREGRLLPFPPSPDPKNIPRLKEEEEEEQNKHFKDEKNASQEGWTSSSSSSGGGGHGSFALSTKVRIFKSPPISERG